MFVCPDCKTLLEELYCGTCRFEYFRIDGIPVLFPREGRFTRSLEIAQTYDQIYADNPNVWEQVGRTREFISYFSSTLLARFPLTRFLEIGCGEGYLLASVPSAQKHAVDLSVEAIKAARTRAAAEFSLALAERLPYPGEYFDMVASVGVMEHFLDIDGALHEIWRVLKPGGHCVTLTHVNLTFWDRVAHKISEYLWPRPRPARFAKYLAARFQRRAAPERSIVKQPIQNQYTTRGAKALLEKSGFRLIDVLHTRKDPSLPLKGHYVVIYVGRK